LSKYEREKKEIFNFLTPPWVIMIDNNFGLIRCAHTDKDRTIKFLTSITELIHREQGEGNNRDGVKIKVKIYTLGTTGTIKSAKAKYFRKFL
jgi:RNase P/RNase MRP subunit POP5